MKNFKNKLVLFFLLPSVCGKELVITKMKTTKLFFLSLIKSGIVSCILYLNGFAHNTGNITGKVLDAETSKPVPFVNVVIKGTFIGTTTDLNGDFIFKNIYVGTYEVQTFHIGYEPATNEVVVKEGETTDIVIKLKPVTFEVKEVLISAERPISSASSQEIRNIDLEIHQNRSTQDMLQLVPGLVITQHQGGGKAEQILIRGFDCDHGTDINIMVDGMPVNMVTHAHGQGYADLHFLIPEVVEGFEVYKGPYFTEFGDFSTAASVVFKTKDLLENNLVRVEGGMFNTYKTTMLYQIKEGGSQQNAYFAGQYYHTNGPFKSPQNFQRLNLFGKYFSALTDKSKITVSLSSFSSSWDASGQIPERAVKSGLIDRFGAIDDFEGGTTGRQNVILEYSFKGNNDNFIIQNYFSKYNFKLFSNFTFFLVDSINGDMIEQVEDRDLFGLNAKYNFSKEIKEKILKTTLGGGFRADNIDVALWHSPYRKRLENFTHCDVYQRNFFLFVQEDFILSSKFRFNIGLREDYFTFNVDDKTIIDSLSTPLPHASGFTQQSILSPKFNMIITPKRNLDIYLNFGCGFRSNDARNVIIGKKIDDLTKYYESQGLDASAIDELLKNENFLTEQKGVSTLPRCIGSEFGLRTKLKEQFHWGLDFWYLYLEKEFVYVGDGGFTELSDPTQRFGIDIDIRWRLLQWLWAKADFSFSRAEIIGLPKGENYIPLAPQIVSTGGLNILNFKKITANLFYRYVSDRPGNEDFSHIAPGHLVFNTGVSYEFKKIQFSVFVENILNTEWNEAQFDTETRLKGESEPITEICFTPGNPRNFQIGISYLF